jgi:fructose-bisphosphate aldolase, class II
MPELMVIVQHASKAGEAIPAFNIPYLPMLEPVVRAVVNQNIFAMIETARLEWFKYEASGPEVVAREFFRWQNPEQVSLHLDHVPVIDEDGQRVDYLSIIQQAIDLGYHSMMVDGSRLPLDENIAATFQVVAMAHQTGIPCEAELGAISGHEAGLLPQYDELFASGKGFTKVDEAPRFLVETGCDWLSVSIGNIHGSISVGYKDQKKIAAQLNLDHSEKLFQVTTLPLVLHGASGIPRESVLSSFRKGIAKINIATEIRQAYESILQSLGKIFIAQGAVYERTSSLIGEYFCLNNIQPLLIKAVP